MARKPSPCGTEAAYRRHRRNGEDPCEDCKRAAAAARAMRRGEKKTQDVEIREVAPDLFKGHLGEDLPDLDIPTERRRLYMVLDAALPLAMPREVSSLVREMRSLLQDLEKTAPPGGEKSLADQLEEAKRARREATDRVPAAQA